MAKQMETGHATYEERVQNGGMSKEEKAFLMHELAEDFRRLAGKQGEGKKVLHVSIELSLGKAISGLHKATSCGVYLYFMGKPPTEDEFRRWFHELYGERVMLQKFHFAGKGFFQAVVETEMQRELVLSTVTAFRGNLVYAVPWSPALQPEEMLQHQCPVWVSFPNLPYYLWDQVKEVASALGKVLFTPKPAIQETKGARKACILWDRRNEIPDFLQFNIAGIKLSVEVRFQAFPDTCYKCRLQGHFAKDCPGPQATSPKQTQTGHQSQPEQERETPSMEIIQQNKGKEADNAQREAQSKQSKC